MSIHRRTFVAALAGATSALALVAAISTPARAEPGTMAGLKVAHPSRTLLRIEREKIDGERFRIDANETLELVLSDGASISVAPGSVLVVDAFDFDRVTGAGQLRLHLEQGAVRVMGGRLNRNTPISIMAGGATMEIMDGGAFISTDSSGTRAALVMGASLKITAGSQTQTIQRAGYESWVRGGAVSEPTRQAERAAFADAALLNPGLGDGAIPVLVTGAAAEEAAGDAQQESLLLASTNDNITNVNVNVGAAGRYDLGGILRGFQNTSTTNTTAGGVLNTGNETPDVLLKQVNIGVTDGLDLDRETRAAGATTARVFGINQFGSFLVTDPSNPTKGVAPQYAFSAGQNNLITWADGVNPEFTYFDSYGQLVFVQPKGFYPLDTSVNPFQLHGIRSNGAISIDASVRDGSGHLQPWLMNRRANGYVFSLGPKPAPDVFKLADPNPLTGNVDVTVLQAGFNADTKPGAVVFDASKYANDPSVDFKLEAKAAGDLYQKVGVYRGLELLEKIPLVPVGVGRDAENFVAVQISNSAQTTFLATGDVKYIDSKQAGTIDTYTLSRGLNTNDFKGRTVDLNGSEAGGIVSAYESKVASDGTGLGFRAFLPDLDLTNYDLTNADLVSTALYIANLSAAQTTAGAQNALFQADLSLSATGQSSTISATLGSVTYSKLAQLTNAAGQPQLATVTVDAKTVGVARKGATGNPTLLTAKQTATSAGGGNDWDPGAGEIKREGYAGYLVLETSDGAVAPLVSGIGATGTFGQLRLATGYTSKDDSSGATKKLTGFVAGLVDFVDRQGAPKAEQWSSKLTVETDAAKNTVSAHMTGGIFSPHVSNGKITGTSAGLLALGAAAGGANAYVDEDHFGAQDSSGSTALIAGDSVKKGLGVDRAARIGDYRFTQWGFFWGKVATPTTVDYGAPTGQAAFSSWAANEALASDYKLKGTASYAGHMIGEVTTATDRYVQVGTFTQAWNLDARTGSMKMSFGPFQNLGVSALGLSSTDVGAYAGYLDGNPNYTGYVEGRLGSASDTTKEGAPNSTVGAFQIQGSGASAIGTFGGDKVGVR